MSTRPFSFNSEKFEEVIPSQKYRRVLDSNGKSVPIDILKNVIENNPLHLGGELDVALSQIVAVVNFTNESFLTKSGLAGADTYHVTPTADRRRYLSIAEADGRVVITTRVVLASSKGCSRRYWKEVMYLLSPKLFKDKPYFHEESGLVLGKYTPENAKNLPHPHDETYREDFHMSRRKYWEQQYENPPVMITGNDPSLQHDEVFCHLCGENIKVPLTHHSSQEGEIRVRIKTCSDTDYYKTITIPLSQLTDPKYAGYVYLGDNDTIPLPLGLTEKGVVRAYFELLEENNVENLKSEARSLKNKLSAVERSHKEELESKEQHIRVLEGKITDFETREELDRQSRYRLLEEEDIKTKRKINELNYETAKSRVAVSENRVKESNMSVWATIGKSAAVILPLLFGLGAFLYRQPAAAAVGTGNNMSILSKAVAVGSIGSVASFVNPLTIILGGIVLAKPVARTFRKIVTGVKDKIVDICSSIKDTVCSWFSW